MLNIDNFNLPDNVKITLDENGLSSGNKLLPTLEAYKFLSREEIIKTSMEVTGAKISSIRKLKGRESSANLEIRFKELEDEFNVIIDRADDSSYLIIMDINNPPNKDSLQLEMPSVKYYMTYVTPINFLELRGEKFTSWNYRVLFFRIVMDCVKRKGSDIHITVKHVNMEPVYVLKYRIGEDLVESDLFEFTKEMNNKLSETVISLSSAVVGDLQTPDGAVAGIYDVLGDGRVIARPAGGRVKEGYHLVCRLQVLTDSVMKINELGFDERIVKDLYNASEKTNGLTLITGGIRTGKNITSLAIVTEMMNYPISVMDLSSPMEFLLPTVQVDYQASADFLKKRIKLLKKQDVNVVNLNEIPDKSVAFSILDLTYSNIHVITTTHLSRLWTLPYKLKEFYDKSFKDILSQMNLVMTQRMFAKQCPHCRNIALVSNLEDQYREIMEHYGHKHYYVNKGCEYCVEGKLKEGVQPYAEHLIFSETIISDLLRFEEAYDMEAYLKDVVISRNQNLEYYMCKGVNEGKLHYSALKSILPKG